MLGLQGIVVKFTAAFFPVELIIINKFSEENLKEIYSKKTPDSLEIST